MFNHPLLAVFSQNNLADKISTYSVLFSLLSFMFEVESILSLLKIFMQETLCGLFTNSSISRAIPYEMS